MKCKKNAFNCKHKSTFVFISLCLNAYHKQAKLNVPNHRSLIFLVPYCFWFNPAFSLPKQSKFFLDQSYKPDLNFL